MRIIKYWLISFFIFFSFLFVLKSPVFATDTGLKCCPGSKVFNAYVKNCALSNCDPSDPLLCNSGPISGFQCTPDKYETDSCQNDGYCYLKNTAPPPASSNGCNLSAAQIDEKTVRFTVTKGDANNAVLFSLKYNGKEIATFSTSTTKTSDSTDISIFSIPNYTNAAFFATGIDSTGKETGTSCFTIVNINQNILNKPTYCLSSFKTTKSSSGIDVSTPNMGIETAIGCIPTDPAEFIKVFLNWAIGIAGGIAFMFMLFAAFQILASRGNPEALKAAQEQLTAAVIGLLFIIFSVFLLRIIGVPIMNIGT